MSVVKVLNTRRVAILFVSLFLVATQASCGNQELMEKARQKVFLLNKEILKETNQLPEGNVIEFSGRVKKTPDGKLQFTIDELKETESKGTSKYIIADQLPTNAEIKPSQVSQGGKHEYIRYVLFEDMIKSKSPVSKQGQAAKSTFQGGGQAVSQ